MTRSEELGLLIDIEYGFYRQYRRWYQSGRLSETDAVRKIGQCCCVIAAYRSMCAAELQPEDYPEIYFADPPEQVHVTDNDNDAGANIIPSSLPSMWDVAVDSVSDQYSIFDYKGFLNPAIKGVKRV